MSFLSFSFALCPVLYFFNLPILEHHNAVSIFRKLQVMRYNHKRLVVLLCQPCNQIHHFIRRSGIQIARRFVREYHRRTVDKRPRNADPLLLGAFAGRTVVFLLVRRFGARAVEVFFPLEKLQDLKFLQNQRRLTFWVFFLFFLPGTPKDVLCYIVGLTRLPLRSWLIISAIAPIPSIVTSTIGGDALGMGNYAFAALVFVLTLAVSGLGLLFYRGICRVRERRES